MSSTPNLPISAEMHANLSIKIKDMLLGMIPDEKLNDLITAEINAFFHDSNTSFVYDDGVKSFGQNSNQTLTAKVSPFRVMVWKMCMERVNVMLKDFFNNPESEFFAKATMEFMGHNTMGGMMPTGAELSEAMEKRLREATLEMCATMFRGLFAAAADTAKHGLIADIQSGQVNIPVPPHRY